nr:MAG TPA: hypothetical protein [Caudoviricetes sp.]
MVKGNGGIVRVDTILTNVEGVHQIGQSQTVRGSMTTVERCI